VGVAVVNIEDTIAVEEGCRAAHAGSIVPAISLAI
jgi:hypothetical protein